MTRYNVPTVAEVEAAVRRLTSYQLRRVFYEGLKNPHWVKPLADLGVFADPPEPEPTGDGYIRDLFWPEVSYLLNVCADAPNEVIDVLLGLEATSNSWVRRAAFVVGSKVPAAQAVRLKPLLDAWAGAGGFGWRTDPRDLVSFAVNLLTGNQTKYGISFANLLFRPRESTGDGRDPVVELKTYWYAEEMPHVVEALGDAGLRTVLPWLVEHERIKKTFTDDFDHSGFARSTIAQQKNDRHDIEDTLIDAVRTCAIAAFTTDASLAWELFKRNPILIADRIAMYAFAEVLSSAVHQDAATLIGIGSELLSLPKCRDEGARVEFVGLARALAEHSEHQPLERAIEEGHFTETDRARIRRNMAAQGESNDEIESSIMRWDANWRHQVLSGIGRELLAPPLITELDQLNATHGELDQPLTPAFQVTSWFGPNSPVDQDEMATMSPNELLAQLESWHVVTGDRSGPGPSHEGQARALTAVLTANPQALGDATGLVERLRPTYVRAVLGGWEAAYKAELDLDWAVVIETLADAVRHGPESRFPVEGGHYDDDPDFAAAKQAAVGLLEELVKPKNADRIPTAQLAMVADLIIEASSDEAAWSEYAGYESSGSDMDPLTTSLNWQWPNMLRALVNLLSHGPATDWYGASSAALHSELARHDPRGASRAVLGEGLGRLHDRAPDWLNENLSVYFGSEESLTWEQQIALTTAIAMHYYHPSLYRLLSGSMIAALREEHEVAVGWGDRQTPRERIGQWVVQAVIQGHINDDDELRRAFYEVASPDVRGGAIGHIAWSFLHAEAVDDTIRDRLAALWDERVHHVESNRDDRAELRDFYWFVRCGKFDPEWWLPRLRQAVELDPELDTHGMIGEQLGEAASVLPGDALIAITHLLRPEDTASRDNWDLRREALAPVIAAALDSGDSELERDALDLMNAMGARGETDLDSRVASLRRGSSTGSSKAGA